MIRATRDYKPLSFREILDVHIGSDAAGRVDPDPSVGGWGKFVRENLRRPKPMKRERPRMRVDLTQHQRKGGAGWLNRARVWKRIRLSGIVD